jgi:hypothetical protein
MRFSIVRFGGAAGGLAVLLPAVVLAEAPAVVPGETPEVHAATGIQKRAAVAVTGAAAPADAERARQLQRIEQTVACLCVDGSERKIDAGKSIVAAECPCPAAAKVRADLHASLAELPTSQLSDKRAVAERLESAFVPMDVTYERVWRFPEARYSWFIANVRCVCEGCKPTIFFANCQLSCTPSIIYKLRARIFLSQGFTTDELIDYYLAEFNAGKAPHEQKLRDWLLPKKQRDRGWLVPALAMLAAAGMAAFGLRSWLRRSRGAVTEPAAAGSVPAADIDPRMRARLEAALDEDETD